jgi:hypothetical protein
MIGNIERCKMEYHNKDLVQYRMGIIWEQVSDGRVGEEDKAMEKYMLSKYIIYMKMSQQNPLICTIHIY